MLPVTPPRMHSTSAAHSTAETTLETSLALLNIPSYTPLTPATINTSYRLLALKLHPDQEGTSDDFINLTHSRDFLLDYIQLPASSADRRHPKHSSKFRPSSQLHDYAAFADAVAATMKDKISQLKAQREENLGTGPPRSSSTTPQSTKSTSPSTDLFQPLTDALDRAYHGPTLSFPITTGNTHWPCSFELESAASLPASDATQLPTITSDSIASHPAALLEIVFGRSLLGYLQYTARTHADPPNHDCTLTLQYCNVTALTATRVRIPDNPDSVCDLAVDYTFETSVRDGDGGLLCRVTDDGGYRSPFFGSGRVRKRRRNVVIYDGAGTQSHDLVWTNTPGVTTIYVRNLRTGNVDCKITRARPLPTEMWAWEPRSARFGGDGSWVVARTQQANMRHVVDLDDEWEKPIDEWQGGGVSPELVVLVTGMLCLDKLI